MRLIPDFIAGRDLQAVHADKYIVHVAVTNARDIYGPGRGPGGTYAHFYIDLDGNIRQHQDLSRISRASGQANYTAISVETAGMGTGPFTSAQLEAHAYLFALAVKQGVPNRIATPENVTGLCWHRLGCVGNYGRFNRNDLTTWSRAQTGLNWSDSRGKTCPGDPAIRQIPEIYARAQKYITNQKKKKEVPFMALTDAQQSQLLDKTLKNNAALGRTEPRLKAILEAQQVQGEVLAEILALLTDRDQSVLLDKVMKSNAALGRIEKQLKEEDVKEAE